MIILAVVLICLNVGCVAFCAANSNPVGASINAFAAAFTYFVFFTDAVK